MNAGRRTIGYFNQVLQGEWGILPWQGAIAAARKHGATLLSFHGNAVLEPNGFDAQENIIYDLARDGRLDGLIAWKGHLTNNLPEADVDVFYRRYGVPVVTIEGQQPGFPCVTYGNYEGMKLVVEHLVKVHGFSRIAFIGLVKNHLGFQERYRGFCDAMREFGREVDPDFVQPWCTWEKIFEGRPVDDVLDEWLARALNRGLEAVIGSCDPIAFWLLRRLKKAGKTVPYDIAVAGYDGFTESRIITPPLTTIDPSWSELGFRAMDVIMDQLNGRSVPERTVVPPRLVIAQTCGCQDRSLELFGRHLVNCGTGRASRAKITDALDETLAAQEGPRGGEILDAFLREIRGLSGVSFMHLLDEWLREAIERDDDLLKWQDGISILSACAKYRLAGAEFRKKANILCHQARVFVSQATARHLKSSQVTKIDKANTEHQFGLRLISDFSLERLTDALAKGLPEFGIREAYVALFEEPASYRYPDPAPEWSRLVLAFNENGRMAIPEEEVRFRSREIVPEWCWSCEHPKQFGVYDLFFQDKQIGFAVLDVCQGSWSLYGMLAGQISSALQGTLLLRQVNAHSTTLEKGIDSLSRSIGDMVLHIDSITQNIYRQSTAVEESAGSIQEMKNNIAGISGISTRAASLSQDLNGITLESINAIKLLLKTIGEVQAKSADIQELLSLIREIADRTKLLALNASIQASHAGESGRGFSVVSKEIRTLAENSDSSLNKIGAAVDALMTSINESSSLSGRVGGNLDKIVENLKLNSESAGELSLAMQEQDRGAAEILKATVELVEITSEIKSTMTGQQKATEDFKAALIGLRDSTGKGA